MICNPARIPARSQFPDAQLTGAMPAEVVEHMLAHVDLSDPATLIALASTCRALWQRLGDRARAESYMQAVTTAFPGLAAETQVQLPGQLASWLLNIMDKLSLDRFAAHARCITDLADAPCLSLDARLRATWKVLEAFKEGVTQHLNCAMAADAPEISSASLEVIQVLQRAVHYSSAKYQRNVDAFNVQAAAWEYAFMAQLNLV
ncbi:MAG: hypothetical protein JWP36_2724 [Paucimonas sp.]|jgi:hypothetical protein|nr:hypothetical protein [Paucimonas sp.]